MTAIEVPADVRDGTLPVIASVSGGKDSTALILALREADILARYVFADTGWEDEQTYRHLDHLREILDIQINVVRCAWMDVDTDILEPGWTLGSDESGPFLDSPFGRHRAGMVNRVLAGARFPARMQRWCTRELKIEPQRAYHDDINGGETVCAMGIRAQESDERSRMIAWEFEDDAEHQGRGWGGWIWRPLLAWSIEDVLTIHHRHNVPVNPLYRAGHDRVGCYPCIFSQKEEIRLIAANSPARVQLVAALERMVTALRTKRNRDEPGRYKHERASFFLTVDRNDDGVMPIADVVTWSRTKRGGRQLHLLPPPPSGGCMRWGMCEPPVAQPTRESDAVGV